MQTVRRYFVAIVAVASLVLAGGSPAWASYAGTPDPSFGSGGLTLIPPAPGQSEYGDSLSVQSNGDLLVGAYESAAPSDPGTASSALVERLLPNGAVDTSFGASGRVALPALAAAAPPGINAGGPPLVP